MKTAILFFVKFPTPGKVKTRLAAEVGAEQAAAIYRHLVKIICKLMPLGPDTIVMFDPPEKQIEIENWIRPLLQVSSVLFLPQSNGDLGQRLSQAFDQAFAAGCQKVAAIGSDCIEISAESFEQSWKELEKHDCVIGPSFDGGYYLLALKQPNRRIFEEISWSSTLTYHDTYVRAGEEGLSVFVLPKLNDIDTEKDWKQSNEGLKL